MTLPTKDQLTQAINLFQDTQEGPMPEQASWLLRHYEPTTEGCANARTGVLEYLQSTTQYTTKSARTLTQYLINIANGGI